MEKYARAGRNGKEIARENLRASVNERKSFMLSLFLSLSRRRAHEKGNAYSRKLASLGNTWKFVVGARIRSLKNMWTQFLPASQPARVLDDAVAENECLSWAMVTSTANSVSLPAACCTFNEAFITSRREFRYVSPRVH